MNISLLKHRLGNVHLYLRSNKYIFKNVLFEIVLHIYITDIIKFALIGYYSFVIYKQKDSFTTLVLLYGVRVRILYGVCSLTVCPEIGITVLLQHLRKMLSYAIMS